MKYCFVFVCQQGELEIKSMLLAASLKRYLRSEYELVAAIPHPPLRWGTISNNTLNLMKILGVRSVPIKNDIDENYPIGNKVACLNIETSAEKIVFLDSDILCLREFSPQFDAPFNAKPADLSTFSSDNSLWQQIYHLFQLPLPSWRVTSSTSGELMLPYFNAGVIAVQNGLNFGKVWEECCQAIDADPSITNKRPWLDQIALPVAMARLNLDHACLDERFNYPAHLKPLPQSLPFLCHYHWASVIRREPQLNQLVVELASDYPLLKKMLLAMPDWAQLLKPYLLQKPSHHWFTRSLNFLKRQKSLKDKKPEIIITGIPRSGTSYLCRLLHTIQDCVIISEPRQIFAPLNNNSTHWQVATFYQELRRDILDGKPIENKVHNGQIIEDTAVIDVRAQYLPQVSRQNFLLGTKNTLAYMARLPQLRQILPHAPIIACVRHPLDTIASWKTSFPHLKHAIVTEFPVGHVNDPFLTQWQRHRLAEIAAIPEDALKRALLWCYLAEYLLIYTHQITLIRYEEIVRQPAKVLQTLLQQIPNAPPFHCIEKITPSIIRQKREILDKDDIQAIGDICSQHAMELGYRI
ncbi:sulfotransferase [Candidatus Parabeggiatoa sp. HSG14]|uniref:sulfotransferase n=1 Tax=Candidatus Parabeggiatoa sp. HSG14 TaxID=3055593 RepID=UPI0025A79936|nr:sulfotransferase [Thiotrichales bacterium HSG14]